MDPLIIVFGIRSVIRLAGVGREAFARGERGRELVVPVLQVPDVAQDDFIRGALVGRDLPPELRPAWQAFIGGGAGQSRDRDLLLAEALRIEAEENANLPREVAQRAVGAELIAQWGKDAPVGPIGMLVVALAQTAVDYATLKPSLFANGEVGEKLVTAIAQNLAGIVPDEFVDAPRNLLGRRIANNFLRGALSTLGERPGLVIPDEHIQALVRETLPPLVQALPADGSRLSWEATLDRLAGPVASAAIGAIGRHPGAFLGTVIGKSSVGTLTRAFLEEAARTGAGTLCSATSLQALFRTMLDVVSDRPEFVSGQVETNAGHLFRPMLETLSRANTGNDSLDERGLVAVALAVLRSLGSSGVMRPDGHPIDLAARILDTVVSNFPFTDTGAPTAAATWLARGEGMAAIVSAVVDQIAAVPELIVIVDGEGELQALITTLVSAILSDGDLLIGPKGWIAVTSAAAEQVARNPQRLIQVGVPEQPLGVILASLLQVASKAWHTGGRRGGLLFGSTLRDALIATLAIASGNPAGFIASRDAVASLAGQLVAHAAEHADRFGADQWLSAYRALLPTVIDSGVARFTFEEIDRAARKDS